MGLLGIMSIMIYWNITMITWLKFPTGRRRTSSGYFTRVAENLNSGLPRTNPASGQSGT